MKHKRKGKILGKRLLSAIVTAAMLIGIIPQSIYAQQNLEHTGQTVTTISSGDLQTETDTEEILEDYGTDFWNVQVNPGTGSYGKSSMQPMGEAGAPLNDNEGQTTGVLSGKWKALAYALFTAGEEKLSLYASETNITGSVHSNQDFLYWGSRLTVDGTLEAAGGIEIQTAGENALQVDSRLEHAEVLPMPDIISQVAEYVREKGKVYEQQTDFDSDSIVIDTPIGIAGNATFHATQFLGKGIVYATDSITYNVADVATPEGSRLLLASENGNITLNGADMNLNAVLYAPNGCVTINTGRIALKGRIIARKVCINGAWIDIEAGPNDLDMLDFLLKPEAEIAVEGTRKENRKITLSVEEIQGSQSILQENTVWSITKDGSPAEDCYAVDGEHSNAYHKEMIFRKAGTYEVTVTITNGDTQTSATKELVIEEDQSPIAGLCLETDYYQRNEEGKASIRIRDTSCSPDGDEIGQRVWSMYYDANHNGEFSEEEGIQIYCGAETELTYETKKVGNYKVVLQVQETFSDTIPRLLSMDAYKQDDTTALPIEVCTFEVGNEAPQVMLDVAKAKSADIVFTVGSLEQQAMDIYKEKAEELQKMLVAKGIDAAVDIASSATLTGQDTFAWQEYDHYNYKDSNLPTLEKHILYREQDIQMLGYSQAAMKDFLYVADDNSGQKVFEFDLQRDETNWHSMEGGGFLFNTRVSEEDNTIQGYCILVTQVGLKLIQINRTELERFRNGAYKSVQQAGKLLRTYPMDNLYDNHHLKIMTNANSISVWDGEELLIDNFILPVINDGYGFGPIISHAFHNCRQQSYFTFKNITMQTITGTRLSDIVDGYAWRPGASHYVVYASNMKVPELSSGEELADLAAALIENQSVFIGMGNENNENAIHGLLNAAETGGMYQDLGNIEESMDNINAYIVESMLAKEDAIETYITTDDIVTYKSYYQDAENDEIYEQHWEYEYDPSVFGEHAGEKEHIIRQETEPITTFEQTGAYVIRLNVRDNPAGDNDALDGYRKWSGTEEYKRLLVVQNRPIADVSAEVVKDTSDSTKGIVNITYSAQDPDHPGDGSKGIRKEYFSYKNIKDSQWTEGKLPAKVEVGQTYLVKYQVADMEGTLSFPAVAVVKTEQLQTYQKNEDKQPPEIYIEMAKQEIQAGEQLQIEGYAMDDYGVDSFAMYIDGEKVLDSFGRTFYTGQKEGTVVIMAEATDIGGNTAQKEVRLQVIDQRDHMAPIAQITSPTAGSDLGFDMQIVGTAKDETAFGKYTLSYRAEGWETYQVFEESEEEVDNDILGTLHIEGFADGNYEILLTVEDAAGNRAYYGLLLHIETGATEMYHLQGKLTDIRLDTEQGQIAIYGTVSAEGHLKQYILDYTTEGSQEYTELLSAVEPVEEALLANLSTEGLEDGIYHVRLRAWDEQDNNCMHTMSFTYRKGSNQLEAAGEGGNTTEKEFAIVLSHGTADIGTRVRVQVTLPASIQEETLRIIMGDTLLAEGKKQTAFTCEKPGSVTITATGMTETGEEKRVDATCIFYNRKDKNPPIAAIMSPAAEAILTEPVDILGSAYDDEELDFYRLEYRMAGEQEYQVLTESTEPKKEQALGHLDTTMLRNGRYEIRLLVQDKGGNIRKLTTAYTVEGDWKAGAMNVGFTDITTRMGGTTVSVNRLYDSRNKGKGDFGIGWTLDMQGMELIEKNPIAEGYEMVKVGSLFSTGYQMLETLDHDVTVTYGDGTSDRFTLTFTPEKRALIPIAETKIGYRCVTNSRVKLEILGNTTGFVSGGALTFYDENMYGILSYKLTTEDGIEIYLNKRTGVYKIVDNYDNVITVDKDGYHASNGKSILFTRDEQGRIVTAKDPVGNVTTYQYDVQGDLTAVTDSAGRTVSFTYDEQHNLISITDPMGIAVARNEYDENGRLIAVIDGEGNRMEYDYDVEGKTQAIKDSRGNTTVYTYDAGGNILQTIDPYGNKTTNTYDGQNNLLSVTDANGNTTAYAYDEADNLTEVTAADGTKIRSLYTQENFVSCISRMDQTVMAMTYDAAGRIASVEDANGNAIEYDYTADGKLTGLTDSIGEYQKVTYDEEGNVAGTTNGAGESTTYQYDENGRCIGVSVKRNELGKWKTYTAGYSYNQAGDIIRSIDNLGNTTSYEYDAGGNRTACVDAKGRRTTYAYDALGNLVKTTYPDGTMETFTYDAGGNNLTATDRSGQTVTMQYDKLNRLIQKTYADGTKETYAYDAVGNVVEQVSTSGAKTTYAYDACNRNTSITDAMGNTTTYAYDRAGRVTKRTDASGNSMTYAYDENGNLTETTYADGNSIKAEYDARNRIIRQEDPYGNATTYTYDGADRLTGVTDALGNSYTYQYDINGDLTQITDPLGRKNTYEYDALGRVHVVRNAPGRKLTYTYDETGNLIEYGKGGGIVTRYTYDEADRLTSKTVGTDTTSYIYDEKGLLTAVTDKSGTIRYTYDAYNRLSTKTDARGNTLTYTYDEAGRLKTVHNGFGRTTYEYDVLDRITRVIDRNGQATVYEYDAAGNRSEVRYPNGNVVSYTYDACQRLEEEWIRDADGITLAKYSYRLGKAGERLSVTETDSRRTQTQTDYIYDELNRLTQETITRDGNRLIHTYTYDKASNRLSRETKVEGDIAALADMEVAGESIMEGTTTYTYGTCNQMLSKTTPKEKLTYAYDINGNLKEWKSSNKGAAYYTCDKEDRLVSVNIRQGGDVKETYTYDYAGNRTSKTEAGITTYYVTDTNGLAQVVAETDEEGNETASYTRGEDLISMEREGGIWYYLYDGHGNVRLLTNGEGRITDRYAYDAGGSLLEKEGNTRNEFLYTGEQYNAVTGLYYLRARYMDPATGTFITMDSYQGSLYDPTSLHKYLYANANPVMYTDPTGYFSLMENATATSIQNELRNSYDSGVLKVGLQLLADAKALKSVHAVSTIAPGVILGLGIGIATNANANSIHDISVELMVKSLNPMTMAYLVAGDYLSYIITPAMEASQAYVESKVIPLKNFKRNNHRGFCVYLLRDEKDDDKVKYVGMTNDPWRRASEHRGDRKKWTDGKPWDMHIVTTGLTKAEARALEQSLICIYTIETLKNARYEIAQKNYGQFMSEIERAAEITRIPLADLMEAMDRRKR